MDRLEIDGERLLKRIHRLGDIGREGGRLTRLAASDADRLGRDALVGWMREAGLELRIDAIGNIFGLWRAAEDRPVMIGSHIDTVIDAGVYDGCYGVLSGLAVVEALKGAGFEPARSIAVAAFTNEEGVRFAPDMMGSLVFAGGLALDQALATVGMDGAMLGDELTRIGYAGVEPPGFLHPHAYVELHIEQGPVLERENITIGAVEALQGLSWRRITIEGEANHAGTTPMRQRRDAGYVAALIVAYVHDQAMASETPTVATVGCMRYEPGAINVIASRAILTVDLRDPDETALRMHEAALSAYLQRLAADVGVAITVESLARCEPVRFDAAIVGRIEAAAQRRGHRTRRMTSGAGHDAQMIARMAPAAMIFVPSIGGVSHNPNERTRDEDLFAGAQVLLDVVAELAAG